MTAPTAMPWRSEPDQDYWMSTYGLPGLALRNKMFGTWCGYIGIPPGHPLHKAKTNEEVPALRDKLKILMESPLAEIDMNFDRLLAGISGNLTASPNVVLSAHGGITFAGSIENIAAIAEIPPQYMPKDFWYFGFDCCHFRDLQPCEVDERYEIFQTYKAMMEEIRKILPETLLQEDEDAPVGKNLFNAIHGNGREKEYRDLAFVREQCENLAQQLDSLSLNKVL